MIKWTDINDIAIELVDNHPDVDPQYVNSPFLADATSNLRFVGATGLGL